MLKRTIAILSCANFDMLLEVCIIGIRVISSEMNSPGSQSFFSGLGRE